MKSNFFSFFLIF